jgi:hypothetical protein
MHPIQRIVCLCAVLSVVSIRGNSQRNWFLEAQILSDIQNQTGYVDGVPQLFSYEHKIAPIVQLAGRVKWQRPSGFGYSARLSIMRQNQSFDLMNTLPYPEGFVEPRKTFSYQQVLGGGDLALSYARGDWELSLFTGLQFWLSREQLPESKTYGFILSNSAGNAYSAQVVETFQENNRQPALFRNEIQLAWQPKNSRFGAAIIYGRYGLRKSPESRFVFSYQYATDDWGPFPTYESTTVSHINVHTTSQYLGVALRYTILPAEKGNPE